MSETVLADGSRLCVGGEHEDYYDPDFCIYNDAVVISPDGGRVAVYAYSKRAFPPTDFHAAVPMPTGPGGAEEVWLVGSVGYKSADRRAYSAPTQVLRIDPRTMHVALVETCGDDWPVWASFGSLEALDGDGCKALDGRRIEVRVGVGRWTRTTGAGRS
jgi:hypothetical protein